MRFRLTEIVIADINIKNEVYLMKLNTLILKKFHFYPEKILTGRLTNNKLKAKINPPVSLADPFRSIVGGTIESVGNSTHLNLKIRPGWGFRIPFTLWIILLFYIAYRTGFINFISNLEALATLLGFTLFQCIMMKLKVRWDKNRLIKQLLFLPSTKFI